MKKNKFAIIGNGFIAPKHREAIKSVGGSLVGVCDIDDAKEIFGIPFYDNYQDLIKNSGADFISICAPNYLHTEMILEAAKHGKTILCEKPMTFKIEEFELMKGVPRLFGMFQLRYLPEIGEIRKASKDVKEVTMIVEMKRSKSYYNSWKGDDTKTGGLLMNIGCHYFDLIGHLFGYDDFNTVSIIEDTQASGTLMYEGLKVNWNIAFTEEKESYERAITIDGKKFDLVQRENLHVRAYEDLMWGHGVTACEEEKIIKMINKICKS